MWIVKIEGFWKSVIYVIKNLNGWFKNVTIWCFVTTSAHDRLTNEKHLIWTNQNLDVILNRSKGTFTICTQFLTFPFQKRLCPVVSQNFMENWGPLQQLKPFTAIVFIWFSFLWYEVNWFIVDKGSQRMLIVDLNFKNFN